MKQFVLVATMACAIVSGEAMAACSGNSLSVAQLNTLLTGNTVCSPSSAPFNWQELHQAGGALIDYKRGPGHAVDPSETVGSWAVAGNNAGNNAKVTHNYGSGGSYTYTVYGSGVVNTPHSFCGSGPEIVTRIKSGGGAC
ncbi:MAG: hypothetical protein ABJA84_03090 [Polaromonas sp.]